VLDLMGKHGDGAFINLKIIHFEVFLLPNDKPYMYELDLRHLRLAIPGWGFLDGSVDNMVREMIDWVNFTRTKSPRGPRCRAVDAKRRCRKIKRACYEISHIIVCEVLACLTICYSTHPVAHYLLGISALVRVTDIVCFFILTFLYNGIVGQFTGLCI
jgi:hypothetical protein